MRFQTLITSEAYRDSDNDQRKNLIGTFVFDYVKVFLDQLMAQRGIATQQQNGLAPKVTGMIMSLPHQHLTVGISTYAGLLQKVQEALNMLIRAQPQQHSK